MLGWRKEGDGTGEWKEGGEREGRREEREGRRGDWEKIKGIERNREVGEGEES